MKKNLGYIGLAIAIAVITSSAKAQGYNITVSEKGDSCLLAYEKQRINGLPWIQAYQSEDGVIHKAADADGWSVGGMVGYEAMDDQNTPVAGIGVRHDHKRFSYETTIFLSTRKYNVESVDAGTRYKAYGVKGDVHYNVYTDRKHFRTHILSVYATGGYIFDRHKYKVGEEDLENGYTLIEYVNFKGSGLTYGAGLEYRHNLFATGNSYSFFAEVRCIPNVYVNDTKTPITVMGGFRFHFGISRNRVRFHK